MVSGPDPFFLLRGPRALGARLGAATALADWLWPRPAPPRRREGGSFLTYAGSHVRAGSTVTVRLRHPPRHR